MSNEFPDDEILKDNEEIIEDIAPFDTSSIVVYSRDWTIETMYSQIMGKNINLNPKYQRRNAWTDQKRSQLIESIIIGYPVPEIVLAEDPIQKKSFSVIDGKQRLLTIAGFINPEDTLVLVTRVSLGKMAFVKKPTALNQDLTALLFDEEQINKRYACFYLLSIVDKIERDGHGATVKGVTRDYVREIKIPLPSKTEQAAIVQAIEEEMQLVHANKRLVEIFEHKIKDKISEFWGVKEDETLSMAAESQTTYNNFN